jgi:hypothetical protein
MDTRANPKLEMDGESYLLDLWTTSDNFEWQQRLAELGLEAVAMLFEERKQEWADLTEADYPVIARELLSKLDRQRLGPTVKDLLKGVTRFDKAKNGTVPVRVLDNFDMKYRGQTLHVYKLCGWVIAENLSDFMIAARWLGKALQSAFSTVSKNATGDAAEVVAEMVAEASSGTPT